VAARRMRQKTPPGENGPSTTFEPMNALLEKIQASEARYRRLFETAQDGILLLDAKTGEITDVNPFLIHLLGYAYDEITGKKLWEIGPFVDRAAAKQAFEKLQRDRYIRYDDLPLQTATGTRIQVEFVSNVYLVDGREVIQCNIRDITERRRAAAALADSELKYRQVVENAGQGVFVVQGARIVFLNPMAAAMIGHSREKAMGRPFAEFIHPEDRSMVVEQQRKRMEGEEVPAVCGFRVAGENGATRWVEQNAARIDWQGEPATLTFLSDITERMLAVRENVILARFPDENPNPVLRVSRDGRIAYANSASDPLLRFWKTTRGESVPADWQERVAHALGRGASEDAEAEYGDRVYSIVISPGRDTAYANLYGRDITERRQAALEREGLLKRQIAINRITLSLGAATDLRSILRTLHDEVRTLLDADGFFISTYDRDTRLVTALFMIDEGVERDVSQSAPIPLAPQGKGMQSEVLRTGRPLNVPNWIERARAEQTVQSIAPDGALAAPPVENDRDECTKSALLVPMMLQGQPSGVLQVQSNRLNAYSDEDLSLLAGLANVAAISIRDARLVEEVRHGLEGTIEALAGTAEMRDPYTAGHQRRVSQLASAIAREMGLAEKTVEGLRVSGLLHDVGKVSVPAEILSKPGALTTNEFSLVKEHVRAGFDILKGIVFPWPVAEMVLQHHERLDGSGYPRGLKGEAICLEARILAVADVVEAMASHRPYRPALKVDAALQEIREHRGKLYDSDVVKACVQLFADGFALVPAERSPAS
jgi:PAS domain S-box-containing protein/putative nucleotidyltransferase with HDIG domain